MILDKFNDISAPVNEPSEILELQSLNCTLQHGPTEHYQIQSWNRRMTVLY